MSKNKIHTYILYCVNPKCTTCSGMYHCLKLLQGSFLCQAPHGLTQQHLALPLGSVGNCCNSMSEYRGEHDKSVSIAVVLTK